MERLERDVQILENRLNEHNSEITINREFRKQYYKQQERNLESSRARSTTVIAYIIAAAWLASTLLNWGLANLFQ